jgi:Flp pilus assembly protein TadD
MSSLPPRRVLAALVLLLSFSLSAQENPWDAPAFSSDPRALLAAAQRVNREDFAFIMLLDESEYVIDELGGMRSRSRAMYYVVEEAGIESLDEVRAPWQPWHGDRPTVEARVITKEGTVHRLDASAVVEVADYGEGDIFSDTRVLRAPLPAVGIGSVIEYVITRNHRSVVPGAGTTTRFWLGGYTPIEGTRIIIDAPLSIEPRLVNSSGIQPRIEERDGRRRTVYETGRIDGAREYDSYLPYDVPHRPQIAFSTGQSWQHIAASYAAIVERQIENADLEKIVRTAIGKSTDRHEVVAKLLAAIQKDIRYAGIEIGEGSIVPRTPKQILSNKYGDCKDKAALLVAMLRVAGFPAHVALLSAGRGLDTPAELPALGHFNHAITIVEGDPAIWVDPTDVFSRPGELPILDQGRMALIAKPETTGLVRTPETPSTSNVYRESRTFHLPEDGKARVVEVTEPSATSEAALRRWLVGLDAKNQREELESYAKSAYVAKAMSRHEMTEPNDLTRPFRLTVEVPESGSGVVANGEASVAISVTGLPQSVPDALRNWKEPQPDDDPDDAPKKREHDFLYPEPAVREWVYRIIPPAGYVPRTLPASETKKLGAMTYSQELRQEADHTVLATFRFDTGKRRLSVAEFNETRVAYSKFLETSTVFVGFDQIGRTKLNAGDVRGALDEYRRLTTLHPKEAQHHIETAYALLVAGLGDAARDEIRRAIAIEPKNARAHQMLGAILLHDSLGREYRRGFDLDGAIAAFRKAKELKRDDYAIRFALVRTLTYGTDGYRFSRGARLAEAAEEVKAMVTDLGDEGLPMLPELTVIYSHMGRFKDVRAVAPTYDSTQQRDLARVIATAAIDGADAAIRELSAFDLQTRRSYAAGAGQMMMQVRLYSQAAALLELSTQGTAGAADQRPFIDILQKLKRVEDLPAEEGPRAVMRKFFVALLDQNHEALLALLPADYMKLSDEDPFEEMAKTDLRPPDELPKQVFCDLMVAMLDVQQDGDDETGYRLRLRIMGASNKDLSLIVRRRDGRWLIHGSSMGDLSLSGYAILELIAKGEPETARKWLNWMRETGKGGTTDDPLEGQRLALVWPKAKATASRDELRVAAACMTTDHSLSKEAEVILVAAREKAESESIRAAIDLALAEIYEERKAWPLMLETTTRLAASHADSPTAFSRHVEALLRNHNGAKATALAKERLERIPGDRDALHALTLSAAEAGDYAAAQQYAVQVVDQVASKREDYVLAAWMALFTGTQLERAIEHAQHASKDPTNDEGSDPETVSALHALAALYAMTGRSVEARTALLKEMDDNHRGTLADNDWYILGRIAENYGVNDFAIAAYRRVDKEEGGAESVRELAKRQLAVLLKK